MGTPSTVLQHRTDNKLYRLQTGQSPIVRPHLYNLYGMDSFPNGTNAVVAVISYTGYDMEDAMIINKSAHERGFGHGTVYKSQIIDLKDQRGAGPRNATTSHLHFGVGRDVRRNHEALAYIQDDGLPIIGSKISPGDPIAAYHDETTNRTIFCKYKGDEVGYIDTVRLLGNLLSFVSFLSVAQRHLYKGIEAESSAFLKLQITIRITRSPVIGDKFSSRHGQKGVCSQKWPAIDMPFSESGIQPDVIINPHAFPSRMTIGMLVESIAGKAGAMHGIAQDATPFT
jgi:DNA-directed RNA polymerase I subunit RPA2